MRSVVLPQVSWYAEYFLWLGEAGGAAHLTPVRMSALGDRSHPWLPDVHWEPHGAGKLQEVKWIPQRPVTYPGQNF